MKFHTSETLASMTPAKALQFLKEGNERFVSNLKMNRELLEQVNQYKDNQFPFAIVLSCIDSRTTVEHIFDQGLGDVFSARVAGNVINEDILGSMEYACKFAGSKLILVLGHSKCGAVTGACKGIKDGNLKTLLSKLDHSIYKISAQKPDVEKIDPTFVDSVSRQNVIDTMEAVFDKSDILKEMYENGEIGIAGAYYNIETGVVDFLVEHIHE